ncbi:MAG: DUF2614 family zinc ribbon-containing protein [Thermofilaceae archaeon]
MDSVEKARRLRSLIEVLDGFRVGRVTDLSKVERLFRELNVRLPYPWDELKSDMEAILKLPTTSENYRKISKMDKISRKLSFINIALLISSIVVYIFAFTYSNAVIFTIALFIIATSLVLVYTIYYFRTYVSYKILGIYIEKADELEKLGARIKACIEYLLRLLKRELKAAGYKLENYSLKLWLADYAGIRVVKEPSRFSPRYEVSLV